MTAVNYTVDVKPDFEKYYTEQKDAPKTTSNRRLIITIVGVLSLIVVCAALTVAAVYFGTIFHQESFKKFTKEKYSSTGEVYKQEYEVSHDELIVSYTDGVAVFDRKRGLLLYKEKNGTNKCYIAPYNVTDLPDATNIEKSLEQTDSFKTEVNQLIDYKLHPTGVSLADRFTISKAASKTCEGSDIEWAYLSKQTDVHIRNRRAAPPKFDVKIDMKGCTITCTFEVGGAEVKISVSIPWSVLKKN